jgi:hypothetical protein
MCWIAAPIAPPRHTPLAKHGPTVPSWDARPAGFWFGKKLWIWVGMHQCLSVLVHYVIIMYISFAEPKFDIDSHVRHVPPGPNPAPTPVPRPTSMELLLFWRALEYGRREGAIHTGYTPWKAFQRAQKALIVQKSQNRVIILVSVAHRIVAKISHHMAISFKKVKSN